MKAKVNSKITITHAEDEIFVKLEGSDSGLGLIQMLNAATDNIVEQLIKEGDSVYAESLLEFLKLHIKMLKKKCQIPFEVQEED